VEAIIFIGIQATGKSTFYQERFYNTHVRINLDMLRTRNREDILLDACIRAQQSFVIDNTNILARERAKYITLAREAGFVVIGYYFQSRLQDALQRNQQRSGKAVIPPKGVQAKAHAMQRPRYTEGFDRLYYVSIGPPGSFQVVEWIETEANMPD
jgi:predicted kinase